VRRAVGDEIILMSDFNQGLAFNAALRRLHQLDDQGLEWFEEPIVFDGLAGSARLARALKTPVRIGENIYGPRHFLQAVVAGAADCYMPDLERIGGVTGWLRSGAIAGAAGLPMSTHLYPEFSAHLMRVTETADWLEWRDWANPFLAEPFEIRGSAIHIPDRPGAGISWIPRLCRGDSRSLTFPWVVPCCPATKHNVSAATAHVCPQDDRGSLGNRPEGGGCYRTARSL
jgi:mandelate racemase